MEKKLHIMRGIPGSGKSFKAKTLAIPEHIFATDDFWINPDGKYVFDYKKLKESHEWNQDRVNTAMSLGKTPIVVDNTNVATWEYQSYMDLSKTWGYSVEIQFPESPWWLEITSRLKDGSFTDEDVQVFLERNTHNVPEAVIRNMMKKFTF